MSTSHATLKLFRQVHLYIGVFIAPALLFFAFTGALQTFSLHETTPGSSYKPPAWAVTLGQLHKKQTTIIPVRKQRPADVKADKPTEGSAPKSADGPVPKPKGHLPLKIFFLLVSIGLFISTLTGIYMAYKFNRKKSVISVLLLAGVAAPLLLSRF